MFFFSTKPRPDSWISSIIRSLIYNPLDTFEVDLLDLIKERVLERLVVAESL